jgi:molybdopterin-guanine dinucleotide biosynthesis protein A
MGQDKALILWDGVPILQRVCAAAQACCQQVYLLTPWPQRYRPIVSPQVEILLESSSGQGPLIGFAQALTAIPSDWILLLACDLPLLDPIRLTEWGTQIRQLPPQTLALVPQGTQGWDPLCGFYHRSVSEPLSQFIAAGGRSFQAWLDQIPVQPLWPNAAAKQMLWNCNTPEDLELKHSYNSS